MDISEVPAHDPMAQFKINRRGFLRLSLAATTALTIADLPDAAAAVSNRLVANGYRLRPLPCQDVARAVTLTAAKVLHQFHPDMAPVATLTYGAGHGLTYLGPTLQSWAGAPFDVTLRHEVDGHPLADDIDEMLHGVNPAAWLNPPLSMHLHGGAQMPSSDGHPEDRLYRGKAKTYRYQLRQDAATLWYHDHALGMTRLNVYAGLAGVYLLHDRWDTGRSDNRWGLPTGDHDVPLILQDKAFAATSGGAALAYRSPGAPTGTWQPEFFGSAACVNGAITPVMPVDASVYRLRILNGSNTRSWDLAFSNGMSFHVIGTDNGLLNQPVPVASLRVSPGERYDVLVDFGEAAPGQKITLRNSDIPAQAPPEARIDTMMTFARSGSTRGPGVVPAVLRSDTDRALPPRLPETATLVASSDKLPVRRFTAVEVLADAMHPRGALLFNNQGFHLPDSERVTVLPGTSEVWELINPMPEEHPIHVHLRCHRVLSIHDLDAAAYLKANPLPATGVSWSPDPAPFLGAPRALPPQLEGKKDTVLVPAQSVVRVRFDWPTSTQLGFDPTASYPAVDGGGTLRGYMLHCHILEHEDNDMMQQFNFG